MINNPPDIDALARLIGSPTTQFRQVINDIEKHYHSCVIIIKKKKREITIPSKALKAIQKKINHCVLRKVKFPSSMHGYIKGRSVYTNAQCHVGKKFIAKFDIKNFFPSIHYSRVSKIFQALEFKDYQVDILTKLTTADYCLPHGFVTSSTLAVLALINLERRFSRLFKNHQFSYSFYSDDITISANRPIAGFERLVTKMLRQEGFDVKKDKIEYSGNYERQEVTGMVVNNLKPAIPLERRQLIKAIVHNCSKNGPRSQINRYWDVFGETSTGEKSKSKFKERLLGQIEYISVIHRAYGLMLRKKYNQINWSN